MLIKAHFGFFPSLSVRAPLALLTSHFIGIHTSHAPFQFLYYLIYGRDELLILLLFTSERAVFIN